MQQGIYVEFNNVSKELQNDKEVVLAAIQQKYSILKNVSERLKDDKDVVLAAVQQDGMLLQYASPELLSDKQFLIECYRINEDTIKYSDFIEQFDELEEGHFDDTFIEENVDILHFVENKEQLCQYLLDNEQYNIIYKNEGLSEYIKDNYNIIIFSCNDIDIEKDHGNDELRENFIQKNPNYNVRFID